MCNVVSFICTTITFRSITRTYRVFLTALCSCSLLIGDYVGNWNIGSVTGILYRVFIPGTVGAGWLAPIVLKYVEED